MDFFKSIFSKRLSPEENLNTIITTLFEVFEGGLKETDQINLLKETAKSIDMIEYKINHLHNISKSKLNSNSMIEDNKSFLGSCSNDIQNYAIALADYAQGILAIDTNPYRQSLSIEQNLRFESAMEAQREKLNNYTYDNSKLTLVLRHIFSIKTFWESISDGRIRECTKITELERYANKIFIENLPHN
jgi:hypothetical protein